MPKRLPPTMRTIPMLLSVAAAFAVCASAVVPAEEPFDINVIVPLSGPGQNLQGLADLSKADVAAINKIAPTRGMPIRPIKYPTCSATLPSASSVTVTSGL